MHLRRNLIWFKGLLVVALIGLSVSLLHRLTTPAVSQQQSLFDAVWETVNDNFFDTEFNGLDWVAVGETYRPQVAQVSSTAEKAALINGMLAELKTSHTRLYTADEPAYYQLLGIFYPRIAELQTQLEATFPDGRLEYAGIGIVTHGKDDKTFVKAVLDGSPAAAAGLQRGDQILSVAGQPVYPIQSFEVDRPIELQVQLSSDPNSRRDITVTPRLYDGLTMFLDAMDDSVDVVEKAGQRIGYIHIWSYAGDQYQEKLQTELLYGRLKNTDALVLDLRDGWGGAPPTALHIYTARGPSLTSIGRDRTPSTNHSHWANHVIM